MRHFTVDWAYKLLTTTSLLPKRRPKPFAGQWPTRVAWDVTVKPCLGFRIFKQLHPHDPSVVLSVKKQAVYGPDVRLRYCGKPSAMRIRELQKLVEHTGNKVLNSWSVEWDAGGLLGWVAPNLDPGRAFNAAYCAYHPQGSTVFSITSAFSRPVYVKRIGRFPTYSLHQKLSAEKVEAFYSWFEKTFERRLRRPKQKPMIVESGGPSEAQENPEKAPETTDDL